MFVIECQECRKRSLVTTADVPVKEPNKCPICDSENIEVF